MTNNNWYKSILVFLIIVLVFFQFPKKTSATEEIIIAKPPITSSTVVPSATSTLAVVRTVQSTLPFLKIDSIGLNIPLYQTSLDKRGRLIVPANAQHAAWYKLGPKIGKSGTAIITGHLNWTHGNGVFINLKKVQTGDLIQSLAVDGSLVTFKVNKIASYNQDNSFPWAEVYATSGTPQMRIVTCDGFYSKALGHYTKNLVVYATKI